MSLTAKVASAYVRKAGVSPPSHLSSFVATAGSHLIVIDVRNPDFSKEPGDAETVSKAPLAGSDADRPRAVNAPFDRKKGELDVSRIPAAWIEAAGGVEKVPVITHCGGGGRGQKAKEFLEAKGFKNVVNGGGPEDQECWKIFGKL